MKRTKTKTKCVKVVSTKIDANVRVYAPHTQMTVGFAFDKIATKKWPSVLRHLADSIESGTLAKELDQMTGCYAYSSPLPKAYVSTPKRKKS